MIPSNEFTPVMLGYTFYCRYCISWSPICRFQKVYRLDSWTTFKNVHLITHKKCHHGSNTMFQHVVYVHWIGTLGALYLTNIRFLTFIRSIKGTSFSRVLFFKHACIDNAFRDVHHRRPWKLKVKIGISEDTHKATQRYTM